MESDPKIAERATFNWLFCQSAQTPDTVVPVIQALAAVSLRILRHNHAPFFGHHEKQQTVYQPKKLTVKLGSGKRAFFNPVAESRIVRVPKKTSTEAFEGVLHAVPKFVAYPSTLFDGKLEVFFQPA